MQRELRRVRKLVNLMRPADSLAARFRALTAEQRTVLLRWRERMQDFYERYPGERGYRFHLDGGEAPQLRSDVQSALFGAIPHITNETTVEEAADLYSQMKDKSHEDC